MENITQIQYKPKTSTFRIKSTVLVVTEGNDAGKEFILGKNQTSIGKSTDNDIVLRDNFVSKFHAEIELKNGRLFIKDLGSTNGTFIDGNRIIEAKIEPGSYIQLGDTFLKIISREKESKLIPLKEVSFFGMVGQGVKIREIFSLIQKIALSDIPILIQGETGTGKELVARAIHANSRRSQGPFIVVNCGSIPRDLIESELFGHEKGAFTSAVQQRKGAFELAHNGTIFLDEIGELPIDMQPKLLRVTEERLFKRVGGSEDIEANFRIIAATNRRLEEEVEKGYFREDLFYRLYVIPIIIPPLIERKEDIPLLVHHFLEEKTKEKDIGLKLKLSPQAMQKLKTYHWPGNVRELKNVIDRAVLISQEKLINAEDLIFAPTTKEKGVVSESSIYNEGKSLEEIEKEAIIHCLNSNRGNKKATAEQLGIAYSTLYDKMKKYDI